MRLISIFFALISFSVFSQEKSIKIKIDTISVDNSNPKERKFTVSYKIINLTHDTISFFLNTKSFLPNAVSSMSLSPFYKIYQNDEILNIDGVFEYRRNDKWNTKKYIDAFIAKNKIENDSILSIYKKNSGQNTDELWIIKNQRLLNTTVTLLPNETKKYTNILIWDKKRYFLNDPIEFYIDENSYHTFELTAHLLKEELKEQLSEKEFKSISANKNFIKGIFTSNKIEINFRE